MDLLDAPIELPRRQEQGGPARQDAGRPVLRFLEVQKRFVAAERPFPESAGTAPSRAGDVEEEQAAGTQGAVDSGQKVAQARQTGSIVGRVRERFTDGRHGDDLAGIRQVRGPQRILNEGRFRDVLTRDAEHRRGDVDADNAKAGIHQAPAQDAGSGRQVHHQTVLESSLTETLDEEARRVARHVTETGMVESRQLRAVQRVVGGLSGHDSSIVPASPAQILEPDVGAMKRPTSMKPRAAPESDRTVRASVRRLSFICLTTIVVVAGVELGSFLVASVVAGRAWSLDALQGLRQSVIDGELGGASEPLPSLVLHPYVGFVVDPSRDDRGATASSTAAALGYPYNPNDALRGRARREDEVVIAVFGGSVAESFAADIADLESRFGRVPRFAGKTPVVLSFALGGQKQPQQLMALAYLLHLGAPFDIVINLDGFNELVLPVTVNSALGFFPFYPSTWSSATHGIDISRQSPLGELTHERRRRRALARLLSRPPWRYSWTAGAIWQVLDATSRRRIAGLIREINRIGVEPHDPYLTRGPRREYLSERERLEDAVALWRRASLAMHALCTGSGREYFHFLQPNQYVPGSKPLSADERRIAVRDDSSNRPIVEKGYSLLRAAGGELRAEGVSFHDLTQVFASSEESLYVDDCCHVGAAGNRMMLDAVARALAGSGP